MSVARTPPASGVSPKAVHIWLTRQDTPLSGCCPAVGLLRMAAALSYPRRSAGGLTNVPLPRETRHRTGVNQVITARCAVPRLTP